MITQRLHLIESKSRQGPESISIGFNPLKNKPTEVELQLNIYYALLCIAVAMC